MNHLRAVETTPPDGVPRGPVEPPLRGEPHPGEPTEPRRSSVRSLVDAQADRLLRLTALDLEIQRLRAHSARQQ